MADFHKVTLRVDRKDIHYIHYIVEGYDGIGTVTTRDRSLGLVQLTYPETCRKDLFDLIDALQAVEVIKEVMVS